MLNKVYGIEDKVLKVETFPLTGHHAKHKPQFSLKILSEKQTSTVHISKQLIK